MSVNKVILLGRLGQDPELRYTQSQLPVCTLSLATNERKKAADGQWKEETEWHRVVTFGKTAENCNKFLQKGRQAYVEGRIRTNKWQDKEGKDRYTTEILANTVQFIGGKSDSGGYSQGQSQPQQKVANGGGADVKIPDVGEVISFDDDDIPF